jgi:predicted GNAT superfamily acetyltransferase
MSGLRILPLGTDHLDAVADLNDREVPRVSPLGRDGLVDLLPRCDLAVVAVDGSDGVAGIVLAVAPGADYASVNYRWFDARGDDFLYVDRVVVAPRHRRQGVAAMLYDAVEERARVAGYGRVTCEVNVRPPNPGSLAFHLSRGFVEVGRQDTTGGSLTVALLSGDLR